ncbi:MAG: domain S-box protein, partial [Myxococcaceae bacterium]|nr:domain S-box protein [Myxococcaceae bacterium]
MIVETVEAQSQSGLVASILLLDADGVHLRHGAAPSLAEAYCQAIDGIVIGPGVGSCGTAAFTRQIAVAADIATDPAWTDFRELALRHDLRACWSTPILSSAGGVLGTFALYHHRPAVPAPRDIEIVELLSRTATLVIERELAEVRQRRARERVLEILDATQDSVFALDADFRIVLVNQNQERTSRLTRDELVGRYFYDVFPTIDEDSLYWTEYHRVARERVPAHFEEYYEPLDLWTEVQATPAPDGGIVVFYRDISVRKRLELEREQLLTRERKARLDAEAARAQAESANRTKDEFLATVSHELRTPLNAMLGWAAMLQGGTLDAAARANAIAVIERNARSQARLIEDLLDVSRILQGKFVLAVGPVELVRVVNAALDAVRPAADAKGIRLQAVLDSHATIVGDPDRLQQVAWNLLSNAIKFTPRGGRVLVTLRKADSYVELSVADTGLGISPDFLSHVFEPFRQGDGTITRRSGGLGLGLSIVHSLVQMHGGTVAAFSDGEGSGATFVVRLPMAPLRSREGQSSVTEQHEEARAGFEVPAGVAGLRVLVVDDEKDTRELLAFLLDQADAHVVLVSSAAEAYGAIQAGTFDLLLSDVGMPGEDGLSLIRRIRQLPQERGGRTPALALTAYARSEDRSDALRAGFSMHL